jgi:hypothetical protein
LKWHENISYAEGFPIYLIFFLLPLPLIFPVYRRYLKGPQPVKARSRRFHIAFAVLYGIISIAYVVASLPAFRHHKGIGDWSQLALAAFWVSMSVDHLYQASKTTKPFQAPPIDC